MSQEHKLKWIYLADLATGVAFPSRVFTQWIFFHRRMWNLTNGLNLAPSREIQSNPRRYLTVRSDVLQRCKCTFQDSITLLTTFEQKNKAFCKRSLQFSQICNKYAEMTDVGVLEVKRSFDYTLGDA